MDEHTRQGSDCSHLWCACGIPEGEPKDPQEPTLRNADLGHHQIKRCGKGPRERRESRGT